MSQNNQIDPEFWNGQAEKYSKRPVPDQGAYELTLARSAEFLNIADRAVEFGCGTASTALRLSPLVAEYVASDLSSEMIRIGRGKAEVEAAEKVRFLVGSLDDERLETGSFDVVLAFNLLHLIESLPQALTRMASLLKPGGRLIMKTPCLADKGVFVRVIVGVMRFFGLAPYVNFFSSEYLAQQVSEAGFTILERGEHSQKSGSLFIAAEKRSS